MRQHLIGAACAAILSVTAFGAAQAAAPAVPQATLGGGYSYMDFGHGDHLNQWGLNGSAALPVGASPFTVQIDGGFQSLSENSVYSITSGSVDGAVSWRGSRGRVGAAVGYSQQTYTEFYTTNSVAYGIYGEWYVNDHLTAGVKGGGATIGGDGFSATGGYVGGELVGYATPNLAITGNVDYLAINSVNVTRGGVNAEYQISRSMPVSVFGGYSYTSTNESSYHANTFSIGLKYYFGAQGSSLVEHQRDGVDNWGPSSIASQSELFLF